MEDENKKPTSPTDTPPTDEAPADVPVGDDAPPKILYEYAELKENKKPELITYEKPEKLTKIKKERTKGVSGATVEKSDDGVGKKVGKGVISIMDALFGVVLGVETTSEPSFQPSMKNMKKKEPEITK